MGVPVVSDRGGTAVGRGGVSLLTNLGLSHLIAGWRRLEEYIQIAVGLAVDLKKLSQLRAVARASWDGSLKPGIMDAVGYDG